MDIPSFCVSESRLVVLRCDGDVPGVIEGSVAKEFVGSFLPLKTLFGGVPEGRTCGLAPGLGGIGPRSLISAADFNSPLSNLLTKPQFELPQILAMIPLGIPPVASVRPIPIPLSPASTMAIELRFVGAGGAATVFGANVVVGSSRTLVPADVRVVGVSGVGGTPGPIGITLWLADCWLFQSQLQLSQGLWIVT